MPRLARLKSQTGIYHCIIRGIDKQDIFLEDPDRKKFIKELVQTKEKYEYQLYAYCLMDNHVHLMIKETKESINKIMQSLMVRYSAYFNKKYERVGHLFQNRYLSKPVENEKYALTLQRYIHQNPPNMKHFKWSSYNEYVYGEKIIDSNYILNMFSKDKKEAVIEFINFNNEINKKIEIELYTELEITNRISDSNAIEIIKNLFEIDNILIINKYNSKIRKKYIQNILKVKGITVGQIARILQLDKSIVKRIHKEMCVPKGGNCPQTEPSQKNKKEVQNGQSDNSFCMQ